MKRIRDPLTKRESSPAHRRADWSLIFGLIAMGALIALTGYLREVTTTQPKHVKPVADEILNEVKDLEKDVHVLKRELIDRDERFEEIKQMNPELKVPE